MCYVYSETPNHANPPPLLLPATMSYNSNPDDRKWFCLAPLPIFAPSLEK